MGTPKPWAPSIDRSPELHKVQTKRAQNSLPFLLFLLVLLRARHAALEPSPACPAAHRHFPLFRDLLTSASNKMAAVAEDKMAAVAEYENMAVA